MDEAAGGKASTGDTGGEPWLIDLGEKTGNVIPTGALTGLAGIANEHDVKVETVARGIDPAMGTTADEVAEDGEKLEEQGGGMGFGMGGDGSDGQSGEAVESGLVENWMRGRGGLRGLL
jgi:hypothetical protein